MNSNKVISSFVFKFIERLSVKAIGLVVSIILARILAPEIFGYLAIIMVFINISITFIQSGLGISLVQNKNVDRIDYSTVFWMSLLISIALIVIIWIISPIIGSFYGNNIIIWPLRIYSLSLFVGALNLVQVSKMQREMQFKKMMYCNLFATLLSGVLGIGAAYFGLGLWALVIYNTTNTLFTTILMQFVVEWKPEFKFSKQKARVHFGFGWKMLVSALLTSLYNDINSIIIGKKYSTAELAFYNRGQQFPDVLANTVDLSVQSVMLPVMASAQDDLNRMRQILKRTVSLSMFFVVPIMFGMLAVAKTMIPLLLTSKWNDCILFMQLFCIASVSLPLRTSDLSVIKAMGRSDMYMKLEIIRRSVMMAILVITLCMFDDVLIVVIGFVISSWLDAVIIAETTKKLIGDGWKTHMNSIWKIIVSSTIMLLCVMMLNNIKINSLGLLGIQIFVGIIVYMLSLLVLKDETLFFCCNKIKKGLGK